MTRLSPALERNADFAAAGRHLDASIVPRLQTMVLTCLDPRVEPAAILDLALGDAMVLRNAGGRVTGEVLADVAFIGQMAEAMVPDGPLFEVAVIHHTQCGTAALADPGFRAGYAERIGADEAALADRAVLDPEATVREDVERLRAADAVPSRVSITGHVYDLATGLVRTVIDSPVASSRDLRPSAR